MYCLEHTSIPLDKPHLKAVRELFKLRRLTRCNNKKSSPEQYYYVRAEQAEQTDFLKYFAQDWIQY